jgi:hypothetical protein
MADAQPDDATQGAAPVSAERVAQLRAEQNLPVAILAGIVAMIVGALAWAAVTVSTEYQIGFMAIGLGFLVGYAVRLGKGLDKIFGIVGAVLALCGCILGNAFTLIVLVSRFQHLSLMHALSQIDYSKLPQLMIDSFSVMDLVFYGIAVYEGYRLSFRKLTREDLGIANPVPAKPPA